MAEEETGTTTDGSVEEFERTFADTPSEPEVALSDATGDTTGDTTSGDDKGEEVKVEEVKVEEEKPVEKEVELSEEEKATTEKVASDKAVEEAKATYDRMTPEQKAAADTAHEEAEKSAAKEVETQSKFDELTASLSTSEKRRLDTVKWAQGLNQEHLALKREVIILQKKAADPDYDPETDESLREQGPTAEAIAEQGKREGRATASLQAAYTKYGEQETKAQLTKYRELFSEDALVQQQVASAEQPVEEAISLVKLNEFFTRWGKEPADIESKMREEIGKELTPKIRAEVLANLKKASKLPKGLSGVKGVAPAEKEADTQTTAEQDFARDFA